MRFHHQREFYIPKGAVPYRDQESSAVVWAYENEKNIYLLGFHGRAQKPDFHYRYRNDERGRRQREEKANEHFKHWRSHEQSRRSRKSEPHGLAVGDVLRSSWGYEQSNVDFYQVVALVGKSMVVIREIASEIIERNESMSGHCVPLVDQFVGEPMRKRANGNGVSIAKWAWASKMEPKLVAGVPVFESSYVSWYG